MSRSSRLVLLLCFLMSPQDAVDAQESPDYPDCRGNTTVIMDGVCHVQNNNAACGYDGGDCCKCTCVDGPEYNCGERGVGFFCIDPDAPCINATASPTPSPARGYPDCTGSVSFIADGDCDDGNNNPTCGYDGGDCCECTCVPTESFICENFDCQDPEASCFEGTATNTSDAPPTASPTTSPTPAPFVPGYPDCQGIQADVGDGYCDTAANIPECGYDGGDCCPCTCIPGEFWTCGQDDDFTDFDCIDPDSGCRPTPSPTLPDFLDCRGFGPHIADGFCDEINNNEDCGYDGGDCCECTCIPGDRYNCGQDDDFVTFECLDPRASCDTAASSSSTGDGSDSVVKTASGSPVTLGAAGIFSTMVAVAALSVAARQRYRSRRPRVAPSESPCEATGAAAKDESPEDSPSTDSTGAGVACEGEF